MPPMVRAMASRARVDLGEPVAALPASAGRRETSGWLLIRAAGWLRT